MRRTLASGLVSLVLLVLAVTPALAAGPAREKLTGFTVDFPTGFLCEFAVRWEIDPGGNLLVFPVDANGDTLMRQVGATTGTVTNLASGASVRIQGGVRQDLIFHADGSIDAIIAGMVLAGYWPTDVGGPSMWVFHGLLHDELDGNFTALSHSVHGRATDLCAALR
jgi:hypothetical protein